MTLSLPRRWQITVRGWFTQGESQLEMMTKDLYTSDQVPVQLRMYLRWQLLDPLRLCLHVSVLFSPSAELLPTELTSSHL